MSGLKIEGVHFDPGFRLRRRAASIVKEVETELGAAVEVVVYDRPNEMSQEYHVTSTPAVVVEVARDDGLVHKESLLCVERDGVGVSMEEGGYGR